MKLVGKRGESGVDNRSYNQSKKINKELSGSKRRSRLNLGIATLPNFGCFVGKNNSLGIIEMVGADSACCDSKVLACGAGNGCCYSLICVIALIWRLRRVLRSILGVVKLVDKNLWKLLRRSKQLLCVC